MTQHIAEQRTLFDGIVERDMRMGQLVEPLLRHVALVLSRASFEYGHGIRLDVESGMTERALAHETHQDPAAEMLISMLEDPNQRPTALLYIQDYLPKVMTPQMKAAQAQLEQVLARPDVSAAIEKVGRRISVPFY